MNMWQMNLGANPQQNGEIQFKVWAPKSENLSLVFVKNNNNVASFPMELTKDGIFQITVSSPLPSEDYLYRINKQNAYPDPMSRCQPFGVHGPSRVYNPHDFQWTDNHWKGIPLKDCVIYELHVGTF